MRAQRLIGCVGAGVIGSTAVAQSTYIALGDSLAFGYQRLGIPGRSVGEAGYVGPFRDRIESEFGEPITLVNLGIPGEEASDFSTFGAFGVFLNENYDLSVEFPRSQAEEFGVRVAGAESAGRPVRFVTIQIGVNDLLDDLDALRMLSPAAQVTAVQSELPSVEASVRAVYSIVANAVPDAEVYVVGYYNPFALFLDHPELDPSGAEGLGAHLAESTDEVTALLNARLETAATDFGFIFVDGVFEAIDGQEATLTRITEIDFILQEPNIHPTDGGYAVIAEVLIDAAFPCLADVDQDGDIDGDDLTAASPGGAQATAGEVLALPGGVFDAFDVAEWGVLSAAGCD
ncbi:MAG: GDSL-type esterase/lipase family protein [Planctomycetota bacterium]